MAALQDLCLLTIGATLAVAQEAGREVRFTTHSDLVLLDVGVKDSHGGYVSNLTKDNFRIYENGKLQIISQFSSEEAPVTVGLVIDDSGSMRPKRIEVINAALAFVDASNPSDEVFVTHFNDKVRRGLPDDLPFTGDAEKLRASLFRDPPEGRTALYDAILFSLHHLDSGKQDKKSLLLVSDGGDNASVHNMKDVIEAVRESRATIYTVGIFDADDPDRNPGLLQRLANVSGGEAFLPQDLSELNAICRQIAKDLRNRYSIGYAPVRNDQKNSIRTIKIVVDDPGGRKVVVHARKNYVLGKDHEEAPQP